MRLFITLTALLLCNAAFAQKTITVKGGVRGDDGKGLNRANVLLYYPGGKDTLHTFTNDKGNYTFQNVQAKKVMIVISYIGFKKFADTYDYSNSTGEEVNNDIVMTPGDNVLETVTIESAKVQIKEDTVSYKVDSTMFRKNDNVEQVLKNLPGVQVDKDGKVTAQGKEVTKVKVNGKEFFGGDVKTATRELNADMVDKIQIIDDYGDQSAFTGIKDGDPTKTLNIQLKKDKNKGYFGNVTAGGGTEGRYIGSLSVNRFNNAEQISLFGNINNTNASTFNFSGLPGGMGAMAGSMMRSLGGSNVNFSSFGNNDGVGITKSIGTNYRNDLSSKVSVYGSYSFSQKANTIINDIDQQLTQANVTNKQHTNDYSVTDNHRFAFNFEYKIDSFNYVKVSPGVTYRKLSDNYRSDLTYYDAKGEINNIGHNTDQNHSTAPNFTGNILFNHRFHKKGRTLSINMNGGRTETDNIDELYNSTQYYSNGNPSFTRVVNQEIDQNNNNHNYGINASFNEQLSKKHALEFNYAYTKRSTGNDKETYNVGSGKTLIDSLTNIYENNYTTNRFGANFRTTTKKYNYSIGLAVQPADIRSNSFTKQQISYKQHLVNYYPVIRYAYNFSKSRSFNLNYNGSTNQPTYQQSQPVADFSNQQNITYGNPDLNPEFSNTISTRYNNFDFISGNVFFGNLSASFTNDKIVKSVRNIYITDPLTLQQRFIRQETSYRNANGYFNANAFYAVSKPIQNRKYVFNFGGTVNFNNNISYIGDNKNNIITENKNTGRNWVFSQRLSMDYKLKKWLEASGGANFTLNDAKYSLDPSSNQSFHAWGLTNSARMFFKNDFILSYDLEKTLNYGYTNTVSSDPLIINATLEKQFFPKKNASVKLQAFDLLNQNTNLSRSVTDLYITDTRTNRLRRYFMLSFVFRFSKFDGSKAGPANNTMGMPGGGRIMMGGPGGSF